MRKIIILTSLFMYIAFSVHGQEWVTDIEQAKVISSEKNRHIILVFQGSDWCAPCIKLERGLWSTEEFKAYAKEHFVLLKADFPRKKNNKLDE